jgi:hypothetical protein
MSSYIQNVNLALQTEEQVAMRFGLGASIVMRRQAKSNPARLKRALEALRPVDV